MTTEIIDEDSLGLHLLIERKFTKESSDHWFQTITKHAQWHRVKYQSSRYSKSCETPCWTTFYGGREEYTPYQPVPPWLRPLVDNVSSHLGAPFNAILLRLYFDGKDEIAWHTDGRTFLGDTPTIASLSLGASATFQMRRMLDVWPPTDGSKSCDECIDKSVPQRNFVVNNGDLLVMRGVTQKYWHHRVPKEKGRRPRLNINFRYIMGGGPDARRGQKTYYKYMVHGDEEDPISFSFQEIMSQRGGMMNFVTSVDCLNGSSNSFSNVKKENKKYNSQTIPPCPDNQREDDVKNETKEQQIRKKDDDDNSKSNLVAIESESKLHSDTRAYLKAQTDIDESIFLSLPLSIQQEEINVWKSQQRVTQYKIKQSTMIGVEDKKRKLQHKNDQRKIHSFFGKM